MTTGITPTVVTGNLYRQLERELQRVNYSANDLGSNQLNDRCRVDGYKRSYALTLGELDRQCNALKDPATKQAFNTIKELIDKAQDYNVAMMNHITTYLENNKSH